jgi:hypothetical protein
MHREPGQPTSVTRIRDDELLMHREPRRLTAMTRIRDDGLQIIAFLDRKWTFIFGIIKVHIELESSGPYLLVTGSLFLERYHEIDEIGTLILKPTQTTATATATMAAAGDEEMVEITVTADFAAGTGQVEAKACQGCEWYSAAVSCQGPCKTYSESFSW